MKMPKNIADVLAKQKGTITSQDISALGISRTMLGRYVSSGLLERAGRGLYTGVDVLPDEIFALSKRNEKMVDLADEILVIWNGKSKGSQHTVEYAKRKNKNMRIIYTENIGQEIK